MERKEKIARLDRLYRIFFLCFAICNLVGVGLNISALTVAKDMETLRLVLGCLMGFFLAADIVLLVISMIFLVRSRRLKKAEGREKEEPEEDSDEKFESKQ